MPATLAVTAELLQLPSTVRERQRTSILAVSVIATMIIGHLMVYARLFADKPIRVGEGANAFFAARGTPDQPSRGESVAALLENFDAIVPANATLAVVPEGAMINFLTHRPNPTPFITLQPPEYLMFGADRITQAYMASPPDFIIINQTVNPAEYGSKGFDVDYGKTLADWIKQNYSPVSRAGRLMVLRKNAQR